MFLLPLLLQLFYARLKFNPISKHLTYWTLYSMKGWFVFNPNVSLEHNKIIEFPLHRSPGTLPLRPRRCSHAPYGNTWIYFWSFLFSLGLNGCTYYVQYNTNPIGLLHCAIRHYSDYVILLFSRHSQELTWSHFLTRDAASEQCTRVTVTVTRVGCHVTHPPACPRLCPLWAWCCPLVAPSL